MLTLVKSHKSLLMISLLLLLAPFVLSGYSNLSYSSEAKLPSTLAQSDLVAASRLLSQATLGANYAEIEAAAELGPEQWLKQQFQRPIGRHFPIWEEAIEKYEGVNEQLGEESEDIVDIELLHRYTWWQAALDTDDPLRQRIAYALSQIFVVSDQADILVDYPGSIPDYNDLLLEHAFGNFRELLEAISLSPTMGLYLSHFNNSKGDPTKGIYPDENYAREVMQLFSIGLYELEIDGSQKLDRNNLPIPTYSNQQITEFAKIFTGLSNGCGEMEFGTEELDIECPMAMYDNKHSQGEKKLLKGFVVPAGQSAMQDLHDALDNLFYHDNVGPFIGRLLIQRLTTSNPSPAYIQRVAEVFADNGNGVRGDMQAVIQAILFDQEAQSSVNTKYGKLREPFLRFVQLFKALNISSESGELYLQEEFQSVLKQFPLSAPSVFNFYSPSYVKQGELAANQLVAPEFQITTSSTIVGYYNLAQWLILDEESLPSLINSGPVYLDFAEIEEREGIHNKLDFLNLVLANGNLSKESLDKMAEFLKLFSEPEDQARIASYLVFTSPEFIAQF